ncbi:MAG TPA: ABC transporter permease subunit [Alphaproteobacteria bacterium]|nr:ABC transporter permease subunit [Alphaproteobacteria bacterium]
MREHPYLTGAVEERSFLPNRWDIVAIPIVFALFVATAIGLREMAAPIGVLQEQAVTLDPGNLPGYALRTTLRMLAALAASLLFSMVYATAAAKSRRLELVLIPILDVLQSVPVLGYLSFTVTFFISLFPNSVMGPELAAIFAIFTSQAWNMTFSFYQSLRTVPHDLEEASRSFHLSSWQRYWYLEVPFALPGLIWNMMMSMSGGWFFVVASEAITVGDKQITLPGIGSYVAVAIQEKSLASVGWAILTMIVVIGLYDQLMFRPMVAWADKFRFENVAGQIAPESWLLTILQRTRFLQKVSNPLERLFTQFLRLRLAPRASYRLPSVRVHPHVSLAIDIAWYVIIAVGAFYAIQAIVDFVSEELKWSDVGTVIELGIYTMIRVIVLIVVATVVWVPLSVMIGLRPKLAEKVQPIAQFLAAFPANLLFPVAVVVIVHFSLNPDIWLTPLMILGTQWYILFNVVAGASTFPTDFIEAAQNFHVGGWLWWRKVMLPGVFPYYVTGAITASGGAWNASIVSEAVSWGDTKLNAHGLGAYIAEMTEKGDFPRIVLGIAMMSIFVILFNRVLWRPLYALAARRLRLD